MGISRGVSGIAIIIGHLLAFPSIALANPTNDRIRIQEVLATYAVYVDTKRFNDLDDCFMPGVHADYGPSLGSFQNLTELKRALTNVFAKVETHHAQSTQLIIIKAGSEASAKLAQAVTYFTSSQFLINGTDQQAVYLYGRYEDTLRTVSTTRREFWEQVCGLPPEFEWRISERKLVFMGPTVGNVSIFQ